MDESPSGKRKSQTISPKESVPREAKLVPVLICTSIIYKYFHANVKF
jgi:hypothetical protein